MMSTNALAEAGRPTVTSAWRYLLDGVDHGEVAQLEPQGRLNSHCVPTASQTSEPIRCGIDGHLEVGKVVFR